MANIVEHLTVPVTPDVAFGYVADFTTTAVWDPMIRSARRLDEGPVGVGSSFAVDLAFGSGPRTMALVYTVTEFEPARRIVLETHGWWFRGRDDITVEPSGTPSEARVRWDATFALRGPLALLDPILARGFRTVAARAVAGLARELTALDGRHGQRTETEG
jgi:dehydrogenase/reductase SDR family protein 12